MESLFGIFVDYVRKRRNWVKLQNPIQLFPLTTVNPSTSLIKGKHPPPPFYPWPIAANELCLLCSHQILAALC